MWVYLDLSIVLWMTWYCFKNLQLVQYKSHFLDKYAMTDQTDLGALQYYYNILSVTFPQHWSYNPVKLIHLLVSTKGLQIP